MDIILQDIRYAARKLFHTPGFTLVAVTTLALAIGSTTAIFSVVNGVLLEPLAFKNPDRLVLVSSSVAGKPDELSALDFLDYQSQSRSFDGMARIHAGNSVSLKRGSTPAVRLNEARVGATFFSLLGVQPTLGRGFAVGEDAGTAPRVVILSDAAWRAHFAADPRVVGQTVSLGGVPSTVVGVAPPKFTFPEKPDIWVPLPWTKNDLDPGNRGAHNFFAIGRVKAGISVETASRELSEIAKRLAQQYPKSDTGYGAMALPLRDWLVGDVRPALYAMLGSVLFVLLIGCANVANLLLVRAASRESEIAVRTALGAARSRIVRQLVTESVLLSIAGAVLGVALAAWAVDAVVAFGPQGLPRLDEITIDSRVLLFTGMTALVTGILFGLVPALHAARPDISQMLREGLRGSTHGRTHRTRAILVVTEMALAMVLLVGAGLLIRSFDRLVHVNLGYRPEHVVSFNLSVPDLKYPHHREQIAFTTNLLDRLRRIPGAQAVAAAPGRPLDQTFGPTTVFDIVGRPKNPPEKRMGTAVLPASSEFFRALGIPLVRGRVYTAAEDHDAPQFVVVNQELVRRYFKNEDPIGLRITLDFTHDGVQGGGEIIGIVGNVKQKSLSEETYPAAYLPFSGLPIPEAFVVRSTADPALVEAAIRTQVAELDRDVSLFGLTTLSDAVSASVAQPRFYSILLGAFAGIALLLAALGIYGVVSYTVTQRTRELGIRIALGATTDRVVRLVIGGGMLLTVTGVAIGIVAALGLTRAIASLLFGVSAFDPLTLSVVSVVLVGVAALASWLPARRAARVDPVIAMRAE